MNINRTIHRQFILPSISIRKGVLVGLILIATLVLFELFNYQTAQFALRDILGDLKFYGVRWATILAIAFCGMDFAGIARLFTPEEGNNEPKEVWYLFSAWLLTATMNAMLIWWGVCSVVLRIQAVSELLINHPTSVRVIPVFVAIIVWLLRVLIIGSFSIYGDRIFSLPEDHAKVVTFHPFR